MEDWDTWQSSNSTRWVLNKLELSIKLGYHCGPAMKPVDKTGDYIVRPIMNLSGMGIYTRKQFLEKDRITKMEPGYFWCEYFNGPQYSIDFKWNGSNYVPIFSSQGFIDEGEFVHFNYWKRIPFPDVELPEWISELKQHEVINVEFIGKKIIEIHLRPSDDFPLGASEIYPIWESTSKEKILEYQESGFAWHKDFTNADGFIQNPRLGFYWR